MLFGDTLTNIMREDLDRIDLELYFQAEGGGLIEEWNRGLRRGGVGGTNTWAAYWAVSGIVGIQVLITPPCIGQRGKVALEHFKTG